MGEHSFPEVFPLVVFTLRTVWYIRYILKTDLNLMISDVVVWQLMDFLQQIQIPHPLLLAESVISYLLPQHPTTLVIGCLAYQEMFA